MHNEKNASITSHTDMAGIYIMRLSEQPDLPTMDLLLSLLPVEERRRFAEIRSDAVREKSLAAHMLVRHLACRYLSISCSELIFAKTAHGKPYLPDYPGFHFNLSHTDRAVTAAVSNRPVGVDVERIRPARMNVAKRFFTAAEQEYINGDSSLRDLRFFEIWTRKEAIVKWSGEGIRTPLTAIDTHGEGRSGMLRTVRLEEYILSACGEDLPPVPTVTEIPMAELTADYPGIC